MKATLVGDIRQSLTIPGAVEFNAFRRQFFYTCPCGCGVIGWVDLMKCYAQKLPAVSVNEMEFGLDGKPSPGAPMLIGLLFENGTVHWSGTLQKGEWTTTQKHTSESEEVT